MIYPGTYHSFDLPNVGNGRQFFGHWLKYDADAAQRSVLEMREFLAAQLAK
jgi:dienelactone hydrolase